MFRWIFRIRATRRDRATSFYRIEERPCKSRLGPGFSGYLETNHFYPSKLGRYSSPARPRRWLFRLAALALLAGLVWFAVESVGYLLRAP